MWGTNPATQCLQAERALSQDSGGLSLLFLAVYFGTFEQGGSSRPFTEREKRGKANTCLYLQGSHSKLPDASGIVFSPAGAWKPLTELPLSYSAHLEARQADWLKLWVFRLNLGVWCQMFCCATLTACLKSLGGGNTLFLFGLYGVVLINKPLKATTTTATAKHMGNDVLSLANGTEAVLLSTR